MAGLANLRVGTGRALPLVLVVHENRGLNPPIEDVARRLALENFIVLAPDTQHGFHNDTTPRFDPAAAALAWNRTLALFNRLLRG